MLWCVTHKGPTNRTLTTIRRNVIVRINHVDPTRLGSEPRPRFFFCYLKQRRRAALLRNATRYYKYCRRNTDRVD